MNHVFVETVSGENVEAGKNEAKRVKSAQTPNRRSLKTGPSAPPIPAHWTLDSRALPAFGASQGKIRVSRARSAPRFWMKQPETHTSAAAVPPTFANAHDDCPSVFQARGVRRSQDSSSSNRATQEH
ncbi:UNVERIFIED_ORG: hypothetical protein ABIC54_003481 [Burkholderia sp. 1263]